jgi:hypothetical protein
VRLLDPKRQPVDAELVWRTFWIVLQGDRRNDSHLAAIIGRGVKATSRNDPMARTR